MDVITRIKRWIGTGEAESPYVCVYCSADLERNYRECPECGKPYVSPRTDTED